MADGLEDSAPLPVIAKRFNVSTDTIRNWIDELGFPTGFYIGRKRFFKLWEVRAWEQQQEKNKNPPPDVSQKPGKTGEKRS